ncbi:MAG: queuosine precursor transporter [Caryophanon sp.]|nr:queuosine precursor transporter [Caryophanon sp.]
MKKTGQNLQMLLGIFVVSLIIANIVSAKIVSFWGLVIPAAIVAYPLTFLITDVIGEIWGKEIANRAVKIGFICQLVSLVLIGLSILLPVAPFADNQAEFVGIMKSSFRVVAASLVAYLVSQNWDVWLFHKLKEKCNGKHKWLRNNASTLTSQMIDTAIFITIAFLGVVPNIWVMILSQYLIKAVYALLDTIPFYLLTKNNDKQ